MVNTVIKKREDLTPTERADFDAQEAAFLATATQRAWQAVRQKRDQLLRATDWAILPDSPHDTPNVRSYRQALRNVPQSFATPEDVVWPANPMES